MFNIITYILVGVMLVGVFGFLIIEIVKLNTKLIAVGEYDQKLQAEIPKLKNKKQKKNKIVKTIISIVSLVVLLALLVFSVIIKINENNKPVSNAIIKVVYSDSMSYKNEKNNYLTTNNLNNQFKKFDMIIIDKLPAEEDLKLYDIVVYEIKETLVIHRIISIQEREVDGVVQKRYVLKGDANENADAKTVTYDQMRGIYTGKKIPFVGVVVVFMQSPAGWIAFAVIGLYIFADAYMQRKLLKTAVERYKLVNGEVVEENKKESTAEPQGEQQATEEDIGDNITNSESQENKEDINVDNNAFVDNIVEDNSVTTTENDSVNVADVNNNDIDKKE